MGEVVILGRDAILAAQDIAIETVEVPEWGGSVIVKGMSGEQRDAFEASVVSERGGKAEVDMRNLRAKFVARCVVDEKGARLFADEDVPALARKSGAVLDRLFEVGQRLAGMRPADVEALAGNSDAQSGASPSA